MAQVTETTLSFSACCRLILDGNANDYAKSYASAGLRLVGQGATSDSELIRVQALYILGNIGHWRGPRAKEVRTCLNEMTKRHK